MPNWCGNDLTLTGNKKGRDAFIEKANGKDTHLSFENFLPTPPELLENEGWYDWRIKNWGTKWDVEAYLQRSVNGKEDYFTFDSAWGPPIEFFKKISSEYPHIKFDLKYDEPGMGFRGDCHIRNGKVNDICVNY